MADWREELRPYAGEPPASAGWRLAKAGWRLLRRDRTLRALALLVALVLALPFVAPLLGGGLDVWTADPSHHLLGAVLVEGLTVGLASFLLVAFVSAVDGAVDGLPLDLGEALGDARERLGPILVWAALTLVVWLGLGLLQQAGGVLVWLSFLASFAWYGLTLFVVPAIAIDRLGAGGALAESRRLFAADWRGACGGLLGILAFTAAAMIPPGAILSHAAALDRGGNGTDYPLFVVGGALMVAVLALFLLTREAFATLQLRAVLDDLPAGEYAGRRLRRRAKVARVAAGLAVVIVVLATIGAATKGDRETLRASREPGANYTTVAYNPGHVDLPAGAPVIYRGAKVGTVLGSHEEGSGLSVTFHVEPGIGPESAPGRFQVIDAGAFGPSLVLIPEPGGGGGGNSQAQPF